MRSRAMAKLKRRLTAAEAAAASAAQAMARHERAIAASRRTALSVGACVDRLEAENASLHYAMQRWRRLAIVVTAIAFVALYVAYIGQ